MIAIVTQAAATSRATVRGSAGGAPSVPSLRRRACAITVTATGPVTAMIPSGNAILAVSTATAHDDSVVRSHASSVR